MTKPDNFDVAQLTKNLIKNNWNLSDEPRIIKIKTEDNKRQNAKQEYILFSDTGERDHDPTPYVGFMADDHEASCNIEFATAQSRDRREKVYEEILRILKNNRTSPPGGWDSYTYTTTSLDDDIFGKWVFEMQVEYEAEAR